ncbi:MAG: helix-turn-helix domain-containing protein [Balneolaceae bacterium]
MPSIGKDLAKIRNVQGLSLQEIQAMIKIPLTTLQSIENGSIFDDPGQGKTYIRSFIRSYGRALRIDDEVLINGLDQQETGNYNHLLWNHYESNRTDTTFNSFTFDEIDESDSDLSDTEKSKTKTVVETDQEITKKDPDPAIDKVDEMIKTDAAENAPATSKSSSTSTSKPTSKSLSTKKNPAKSSPPVNDVNWANMGHKFIEDKKKTPVWLISFFVILIIVAIAVYFLLENDFFASSDQTSVNDAITQNMSESEQEGSLLNLNEVPAPQVEEPVASELDEILYLTIYAAYDRLEPVRVWTDIKPRMDPYWIEFGTAMNFDYQDTIRIRGQYSNLLLFKNGHLLEDVMQENYNQAENFLEFTRDQFTADPKYQTSVPIQTPADVPEPDSLILRPTF